MQSTTKMQETKQPKDKTVVFLPYVLVLLLISVFAGHIASPFTASADEQLALAPSPQSHLSLHAQSDLVPTETTSHPSISKILRSPVVLAEAGALILCQAVGVPVMAKLALQPLRRLRWLRTLSPRHLHMVQASSSRVWKGMLAIYSKSNASKIVNRSKKLLKVFVHHGDAAVHGGADDRRTRA